MQALSYVRTVILALGTVATLSTISAAGVSPMDTQGIGRLMASRPVEFVPNQGQWCDAVVSATEVGGLAVWFERDGWMLDLQRPGRPVDGERPAVPGRGAAVRMRFIGAADDAGFASSERLPGVRNYLMGSQSSGWVSGVPVFAKQRYEGLYPGIDVVTMADDGNIRYDLHLAAGARLDQVVVRCEGADALEVLYDGSLAIHTELGPIVQAAPLTWAVANDGSIEPVDCNYRLLGDGCFGFDAPEFDGDRPLVIDPTLTWGTFLGGNSIDYGWAADVDALGRVTVAGFASPSSYPTTTGAYDLDENGSRDGFVTRLAADGRTLVFSTFLGGAGLDEVRAVCLDPKGGVLLAGLTSSADFPIVPTSFGQTFSGGTNFLGSDAFVAHLDETGGSLLMSAYVGGTGDDYASAVGIDAGGRLYAAGLTGSADFPVTPGAVQPVFSGGPVVGDAFVVCLSSDGTTLEYGTYLGGSGEDVANTLLVGADGELTVGGWTTSTDFDVTTMGFQSQLLGTSDAYVVTLSRDGSHLTWGTLLGGSSDENIVDVAQDDAGRLVVVGTTRSNDFPLTAQATDGSYGGGFLLGDAFVTRFDASGASLDFSSYLGGFNDDGATGISVTPQGYLAISGSTSSPDWQLDADAFDPVLNGQSDAFVTVVDATDGVILSSSFLGGIDNDKAWDIQVLSDGQVILVGFTTSSDFPVTPDAYDPVFNGSAGWVSDCFVVSLDLGLTNLASADWTNLGHPLGGALGEPELTAYGSLGLMALGGLQLRNCLPWSRGRLLLGSGIGSMPLKGGVLVPQPIVGQTTFLTDGGGAVSFPVSNTGFMPSGLSFTVQIWVQDDTGPFKWTASNALQALVP